MTPISPYARHLFFHTRSSLPVSTRKRVALPIYTHFIHVTAQISKKFQGSCLAPQVSQGQVSLKQSMAVMRFVLSQCYYYVSLLTRDSHPQGKGLKLPYGISNFYNFRISEGMLFADKTVYIERLEQPQSDFRYMFLRPHHFGKSAFLGMLCQ